MPHKGKSRAYASTPEHPKPMKKMHQRIMEKAEESLTKADRIMMKRMPESFRKMHESRKKKG